MRNYTCKYFTGEGRINATRSLSYFYSTGVVAFMKGPPRELTIQDRGIGNPGESKFYNSKDLTIERGAKYVILKYVFEIRKIRKAERARAYREILVCCKEKCLLSGVCFPSFK